MYMRRDARAKTRGSAHVSHYNNIYVIKTNMMTDMYMRRDARAKTRGWAEGMCMDMCADNDPGAACPTCARASLRTSG